MNRCKIGPGDPEFRDPENEILIGALWVSPNVFSLPSARFRQDHFAVRCTKVFMDFLKPENCRFFRRPDRTPHHDLMIYISWSIPRGICLGAKKL